MGARYLLCRAPGRSNAAGATLVSWDGDGTGTHDRRGRDRRAQGAGRCGSAAGGAELARSARTWTEQLGWLLARNALERGGGHPRASRSPRTNRGGGPPQASRGRAGVVRCAARWVGPAGPPEAPAAAPAALPGRRGRRERRTAPVRLASRPTDTAPRSSPRRAVARRAPGTRAIGLRLVRAPAGRPTRAGRRLQGWRPGRAGSGSATVRAGACPAVASRWRRATGTSSAQAVSALSARYSAPTIWPRCQRPSGGSDGHHSGSPPAGRCRTHIPVTATGSMSVVTG